MKSSRLLTVVALLSLSAATARAAGPGGVERIATLDLRTTPNSPIAVLYLHRADLLNQQLTLTVDVNADQRALDKQLAYLTEEAKLCDKERFKETSPKDVAEVLRKTYNHVNDPLKIFNTEYGAERHKDLQVKTRAAIESLDKKRDALDQLKSMLESVNNEIKAMNKAACSCSENPKTPGAAAASGPCSCG